MNIKNSPKKVFTPTIGTYLEESVKIVADIKVQQKKVKAAW